METKQGHRSVKYALSPNVCVLLTPDGYCKDLCQALCALAITVRCYQDERSLFADFDPLEIDCLVLASGGAAALDALPVLESLKRRNILVPALVIINDDAEVTQAVRVMRALALECLSGHTPIPVVARHVRNLAEAALQTRVAKAASAGQS